MCRWLAYKGTPIYLEDLIYEPVHSLVEQSLRANEAKVPTNGDGFGIGWYGDRHTPGLFREVLPAWSDPNLRHLAYQIRAGLFFAHVRASTGTETIRPNCHPFSHGRWMFMHNGQIGGYETVRRDLESRIPDRYYLHRQGSTDSELIFYLLLANGLDRDVAGALRTVIDMVEDAMAGAGITQPFRFTASLTDGETIYAVRHASDEKPPTLYHSARDGGLMVVSEPLDTEKEQWRAVPPEHVLVVRGDNEPTIMRLD